MKITVLNTGGTFNKVYNPIKGELEVPKDNIALDEIISNCFNIDFEIKNIISKDSLEITNEDREFLYQTIKNTHYFLPPLFASSFNCSIIFLMIAFSSLLKLSF